MKRSEFAEIVNAVSHEEYLRLSDSVKTAAESDTDALAKMIGEIASAIPATAARTTAEILVRSGLISFEED